MFEVAVIEDAAAAEASFDPMRARLLAALAEPGSATTLAARVGLARQKVNYHLRALERHGLVELVEERRKGNCTERVLRATAKSYVISPSALAAVQPDPGRSPDRLSARWLLALAAQLVREMDFRFLYDEERKLFSIGYRVSDGRHDPGYYDLLASEARLASFIAIARGDVPPAHWFQLSRPLTPVGKGSALVSWSGSMFEYLMPDLVLNVPTGSLLEQTDRLVVARQIAYGLERKAPWGVSESAFYARDLDLTYQYSNFGVGGLGLKRGLSEDYVVAPYATALAAMVDPAAAARNFEALAREGAIGPYGDYESLDYTAGRLPAGKTHAVVRAYMAHHQGMTVVALANTLLEEVMRRRFHAEPMVQATELLLQERTPRTVMVRSSIPTSNA